MDEQEPEFDWSWIRDAPTHELSAHGREVQARWRAAAASPGSGGRPGWVKRLRFRLWLALARRGDAQRRRSRGSVSEGGE